MILDK